MSISILVLCEIGAAQQALLSQRYRPTFALTPAQRAEAIQTRGAEFEAVLTIGMLGLRAEEMDALPKLRLIACMGAGYERVEVDAARARGIPVSHGRGANDECVADHAMGMVIATMRNFRELDRACRAGVWRTSIPLPPNVSGKRLGILGMGAVGERIAHRAQAFRMQIGYHNRRPRPEFGYEYFDTLAALARWCDVLVCAAPGGASTHHLVNEQVLSELGPQGFLVNVGRGSLVDTQALAAALQTGQIAGAGIDVYESEPEPPAELIGLDRLILSPHVGGWSPEAIDAQFDIFLRNLEGVFSGQGPVTPV
ncbi:2-hydroxyacid dehydrogenase [Pigmentiphaga aceris]|uniref:2-hydroxyacid dehydrogenase n=1 Tax=Pigmentiphaga aceris TaxID=1940612 RepID=A0A5C0B683_9BURK|nr:2-hydroxyacid dehydrogenase [Pigmentiphaga aceris]QEI08900.1 2-hydroxyacid dehydrogenase [Pigmentiphaga aceris]